MNPQNPTRSSRGLLIAFVILGLLFLGTLFFAFWAYGGRQDYKSNSDAKAAAAAEVAKQAEASAKDKEYAELMKSPYRVYHGPSAYGSIAVTFPKSWSAYISDKSGRDPFVNAFFAADIVPDTSNAESTYALRVQVIQNSYSSILENYKSISDGSVKIQPYSLPKVPSIVGTKITGEITSGKQGEMIVLPVRDKTLKIWTEQTNSIADFNNIILPNLTLSP